MAFIPSTKMIPRGKAVEENVSLAYVDVSRVLGEVRSRKFSGYLRLRLPEAEGMLILQQGRIRSAIYEAGTSIATDEEAYRRSIIGANGRQGRMDVFELSDDVIDCLSALFHGERAYGDVPLKHIQLRGLLSSLQAEGFTGCVRLQAGGEVGVLFFRDGKPAQALHESVESLKEAQEAIMNIAKSPEATLDVSRMPSPKELEERSQRFEGESMEKLEKSIELDLSMLIR